MDLKFEAVILPVADVDRAKKFYEVLGFRMDIDHPAASYGEAVGFRHRGEKSYRIVQLTPPGSQCAILLGEGITRARPGSYEGLVLVTDDIELTRADLVRRGVEVSEYFHFGPDGQASGLDPKRASYNTFLSFSDPDGNGWLVQEIKQRAPGR